MKKVLNFFSALPIIILLVFPETSIQTSLALEKKSCHSIYLCKINLGLGVADWIIIIMAIILLIQIILNYGKINIHKNSTFYKVLLVYIFYLTIGILYNIFIYYDLIAYLYDFKTFLYFAVTYYWFRVFCDFEITSRNIIFLFLLLAFGSLWDYSYNYFYGTIERPNKILFMPVILPLIDYPFIILMMICFKQLRLFLSFILVFEILSMFNQISLSTIYGLAVTILIIFFYHKRNSVNLIFVLLLVSTLFFSVIFPLIVFEIMPHLTSIKNDGLDIRLMKTLAAWDNYFMNFPIILGKGLGATYFETVTSQYNNVFSTGVHHQVGNVKFILHSPLAIFYKFGIIGVFIMIFILLKTSMKLFRIYILKNDSMAKFISMLYPLFIIGTLITPGILKYAILAGIFIYVSDEIITKFDDDTVKTN